MTQEEKRNIILENYQNPKNKGMVNDNTYFTSNTSNESCIDEINLMAKIENNKMTDIKFDGEACAICTSSTSLMIKNLLNKSPNEATEIYKNFENMINEKNFRKDVLNDLIVYEDIAKQPSRKKCVLLPWWGIKKIIEQYKNK